MPAKKPGNPILDQLKSATTDERLAVEFFERMRWPEGAACPRCGDVDVYQMMQAGTDERQENFRWRCRGCKKQFTVRVGTIMEDSPIPLKVWAYAFWSACASKKGVSSLQIQRETGLSYKSSLFMMHRIRWAMVESGGAPLFGTVEVDETYVGGKPRKANKVEDRKSAKRGRGTDKQPVVAMVERGGRVRTRVVANVTAANLEEAMRECVHPSACIVTDELNVYPSAARDFAGGHKTVKHGDGEYVKYEADGFAIHTNTAEGFFSLFKRALIGAYHHVSREHLHRYAAEREFLYNTRKMDDADRVATAIRMAEGKRLTYKQPALA
ncbi:MAG: IS1595 family transposase [Gemmatimonadetes bacterium]|nr:IS1595 family transposase [Gemmatimonadota bacterium]